MSALAIALLAGSHPADVSALALGSIRLGSAFNQPLAAEIELVSVRPDELQDIRISLASADAFERAGVDRPFLLSKLRFRTLTRANGVPYIEVTTAQPVREPFLDFLIEVNWPTGRVVREYTLLLDPPLTMPKTRVTVDEPLVTTAVKGSADGSRPTKAVPAERSADATAAAGYGPVEPGETLWSIAAQLRPDPSISIEQTMLTLLSQNPNAFASTNVNDLKKGAVLRRPELGVVLPVDKVEARQEFLRQMSDWRGRRTQIAESTPPRPLAPEQISKQPETSSESGQSLLTLVGPSESAEPEIETTKDHPGTDVAGEGVEALKRQLDLAAEEAEAAKQESEELRGRLVSLEEQIASLERLIVLKDEALAEMQARLSAYDGFVETPSPETAPSEAVESGAEPAATAEREELPEGAVPAAESSPGVSRPAAQPKSAWLGALRNPVTAGVLAAVGALVLALLGLIVRRRRLAVQSLDDSMFTAPELPAADAGTADENTQEIMDGLEVEPPSPISDEDLSFLDGLDSRLAFGNADISEEVDPLAEADVYMAYGRYNQAEDLIKRAIVSEPDRQDVKVKLLEIYYALRDATQFARSAEEMYEPLKAGDGEAWQKAVPMGRELCPDHSLFSTESQASSAAQFATKQETAPPEIGDAATATVEDGTTTSAESPKLQEAMGRDTSDTDAELSIELPPDGGLAETSMEADEQLLEFSLDLDDQQPSPADGLAEVAQNTDKPSSEGKEQGLDVVLETPMDEDLDIGDYRYLSLDTGAGDPETSELDGERPPNEAEPGDFSLDLDTELGDEFAAELDDLPSSAEQTHESYSSDLEGAPLAEELGLDVPELTFGPELAASATPLAAGEGGTQAPELDAELGADLEADPEMEVLDGELQADLEADPEMEVLDGELQADLEMVDLDEEAESQAGEGVAYSGLDELTETLVESGPGEQDLTPDTEAVSGEVPDDLVEEFTALEGMSDDLEMAEFEEERSFDEPDGVVPPDLEDLSEMLVDAEPDEEDPALVAGMEAVPGGVLGEVAESEDLVETVNIAELAELDDELPLQDFPSALREEEAEATNESAVEGPRMAQDAGIALDQEPESVAEGPVAADDPSGERNNAADYATRGQADQDEVGAKPTSAQDYEIGSRDPAEELAIEEDDLDRQSAPVEIAADAEAATVEDILADVDEISPDEALVGIPDFHPEGATWDANDDEEEIRTKLETARAYVDLGDTEGARRILDEVLNEGNDAQKEEARALGGRLA